MAIHVSEKSEPESANPTAMSEPMLTTGKATKTLPQDFSFL